MTHLSVESARRELTARFKAAALDAAELDARMLVGHALGLDLTGLIAAGNRALTPEETDRLEDFARRRLAGEPVARILRRREFWGLSLQLSPATLVPRPDTETLVELALQMVRARPASNRRLRIADLGTGSGAILLALLSELPGAEGVGTDISADALQTAHDNAMHLGLADRATFVLCNYSASLTGAFDLIVSNPPYIRSADIAGLVTEVRDHDPLTALDGGADGLNAYRAIIPEAARLLAPGGALAMEVGYGQSDDVLALIAATGLTPERPPRADLAGIPRAVAGRKMPR